MGVGTEATRFPLNGSKGMIVPPRVHHVRITATRSYEASAADAGALDWSA